MFFLQDNPDFTTRITGLEYLPGLSFVFLGSIKK
jgi:hypothetical protein